MRFTKHVAVAMLIATISFAAVACGDDRDMPSRVINLANWKLSIPVDTAHHGQPDEIKQPVLASYSSRFFHLNPAANGVVFHASVGGKTIDGSEFARTELREMAGSGKKKAAWSSSGNAANVMTIKAAITHLPPVQPSIVVGQIHGDDEYVALVRLDDKRLFVKADDESKGILDSDYRLGTVFTLKLEAVSGRVRVYYNGVLKADFRRECTGCYFKAGAYLQSNEDRGDAPNAYGETVIYSLTVGHT